MKTIKHFKTITKHRHTVIRHCKKAGILWQGLRHDLSKYSPAEFIIGAKYYQGDRSPNEIERRKIGYSTAWMHHKGRNKHHFEYWIDYQIDDRDHAMGGMRMPKKYVAEMLADRIAASKVYNKEKYTHHDPLNYFLKGKDHYMMHPQTMKEIEHLLRILDEQGEDACFWYTRNVYLKKESFRKQRKKKS